MIEFAYDEPDKLLVVWMARPLEDLKRKKQLRKLKVWLEKNCPHVEFVRNPLLDS
jgi:hypothetical protein